MSLKRILKHYVSIFERNKAVGRDSSGGLLRIPGLLVNNIRCLLQEESRQDIIIKYDIKGIERMHSIFIDDVSLDIGADSLFVLKKNPLDTIEIDELVIGNENAFQIFEYRGMGEAMRKRNFTLLEIHCQENFRWDFYT